MKRNRIDHLKWCKSRALNYLPADPSQAVVSMLSDMCENDETKNHAALKLMVMMQISGQLGTHTEVRKFIEGFN